MSSADPTGTSTSTSASSSTSTSTKTAKTTGPSLVPPTLGIPTIPISLLAYPYTDCGNAERLQAAFRNTFLYSVSAKSWFIWTGQQWKKDDLDTIYSFSLATIREFLRQTDQLPDPDRKKSAQAWARRSEGSTSQDHMIRQFRRLRGITITETSFDRDPWLFNLQNGTIELRSGALLPHNPANLITKISPIKHTPGLDCPLFLSFLRRILDNRDHLISYLLQVLGYCLTADVTERAVFCFFGDGSNGKTTLLKIMRYIMGDYAVSIMIKSLMEGRESDSLTTSADLARIRGARVVTTSEAKRDHKLSEEKIKLLTSLDVIPVCRKYEDPFEFPPTHKVIMDANHAPVVEGRDHGIWSRLKSIPFTIAIPDAEQDPDLYDKLVLEAPQIFNLLLSSCLSWQRSRLTDPPEVVTATTDWRDKDDIYEDFFQDCVEFDPKFFTPTSQMSAEFQAWCAENSYSIPKQESILSERLRRRGCVKDRRFLPDKTRPRVWKNVRLIRYSVSYAVSEF
jgi:putative DNA primase/helicase